MRRIDLTKIGMRRVCTVRFQKELRRLIDNCQKAKTDHLKLCLIWTAIVITSGRKWPDASNLDASSPDLQRFIQENTTKLNRVWKKVLTLAYMRGFPETEIPWG